MNMGLHTLWIGGTMKNPYANAFFLEFCKCAHRVVIQKYRTDAHTHTHTRRPHSNIKLHWYLYCEQNDNSFMWNGCHVNSLYDFFQLYAEVSVSFLFLSFRSFAVSVRFAILYFNRIIINMDLCSYLLCCLACLPKNVSMDYKINMKITRRVATKVQKSV